jgi:hypothetical protein
MLQHEMQRINSAAFMKIKFSMQSGIVVMCGLKKLQQLIITGSNRPALQLQPYPARHSPPRTGASTLHSHAVDAPLRQVGPRSDLQRNQWRSTHSQLTYSKNHQLAAS